MRRILATSIAAAIPAVLPVHAVDAISYPVDKPAPPVAGSHYRPARAHHAKHHHSRYVPMGETRNGPTRRPENDVKVDADDGGGPEAAPQHDSAGAPGRSGHASTHNRPSRAEHGRHVSRPDTRPGTGADSGFADADDPALPPEAAAAIKEAQSLQNSADKASGPRHGAPAATQPSAAPGTTGAPVGAPNTGTPTTGAPNTVPGAAMPRGGAPARPAGPVTDESTNHRSSRLAGPASMPVAYFNSVPKARGARLTLHVTAGNSPEHTVTLQCDPPGGTHPRAAQACADVSRAGGDLAQMPKSTNPRACFMIYAPVTATAQGSWHGQPVHFTKKYPNTCVMRDKTGSVFDF
jgi:hypothetical protein